MRAGLGRMAGRASITVSRAPAGPTWMSTSTSIGMACRSRSRRGSSRRDGGCGSRGAMSVCYMVALLQRCMLQVSTGISSYRGQESTHLCFVGRNNHHMYAQAVCSTMVTLMCRQNAAWLRLQ